MAADQKAETQIISFTNTADNEATFAGGCSRFYFSTSADVFVDFDQPCDTGSFLVKANIAYPAFDFMGGSVNKIHAKGSAGSGSLYILGVRG